MTSFSSTTFGCLRVFKIEISQIAVEGTPSSSFSNQIFFKATNYVKCAYLSSLKVFSFIDNSICSLSKLFYLLISG